MNKLYSFFNKLFGSKFVSKYRRNIVLVLDILTYAIICVAVYVYLELSHDYGYSRIYFKTIGSELPLFLRNVGIYGVCSILMDFAFGSYKRLWRYSEAKDYIVIVFSNIISFLLYLVISYIIDWRQATPFATMAVATCFVIGSLSLRFCYRIFRHQLSGQIESSVPADEKRPVAIIGAGESGVALMEELMYNYKSPYVVWGLVDDDKEKTGKTIHGIEVKCNIDDLDETLRKNKIYDAILAIPSLPVNRRQEIVNICKSAGCKLRILPDTMMVMANTNLSAAIRDVQVEDLLGRTEVQLNAEDVRKYVTGKVILVTGGGGSIGSELCRQIASHRPSRLIIFDIFENNAYDLRNELNRLITHEIEIIIEIGSVRDQKRVKDLFKKYNPDVVFHAAAHKHVPLMEHNPAEAVKNNIFGTYNLMKNAMEFGCPKFVFISTDKAVNPTSVMGATKRYCEYMTFALSKDPSCKTEFVSVRFGNVLGSSGSVIPLFKRQIELGGPVTITDKRMTRYFMTIPEAASLVLAAGAFAKKTEIYVLQMGEPVKILDLAENLIRLSGFEPYKDIDIKEIGVRPGEKLFEETLIQNDIHYKTANDRIYVERQPEDSALRDIAKDFDVLNAAIETGDSNAVVKAISTVVPEYHPKDNPNR